jgi:hypothetical protein
LSKGPHLCIKREILQNIEIYFQKIVRVLEERKAQYTQHEKDIEPYLLAFKKEVDIHLNHSHCENGTDT